MQCVPVLAASGEARSPEVPSQLWPLSFPWVTYRLNGSNFVPIYTLFTQAYLSVNSDYNSYHNNNNTGCQKQTVYKYMTPGEMTRLLTK